MPWWAPFSSPTFYRGRKADIKHVYDVEHVNDVEPVDDVKHVDDVISKEACTPSSMELPMSSHFIYYVSRIFKNLV